jgi:nitrite reductase (NADH) large subunit
MVVCHCHRVTQNQVEAACRDEASIRGIASRTRAATGCGSCVSHLRQVIENAAAEARAALASQTAVSA